MCAEAEIFIAGWWVVPDVELVRGPLPGLSPAAGGGGRDAVTLRDILLARATDGVQVRGWRGVSVCELIHWTWVSLDFVWCALIEFYLVLFGFGLITFV